MSTELAIIGNITPVEFFKTGGSTDILAAYKAQVLEEAAKLDISTKQGREAIASLAYSVSKKKTGTDEIGKELVEGWKSQSRIVDAERKVVRDTLDALRDEVRKPLTDWEEADKVRIAALEAKVNLVAGWGVVGFSSTSDDIKERLALLDAEDLTNMQEFTSRAELAYKQSKDALEIALKAITAREEQAAEMARLKAEAAERERRERDERIAAEARENAVREAELERKRIEQEKYEAEARAKQAEEARIAAEKKAALDAQIAAELAENQRLAAIERAEREAAEAEQRHKEAIAAAERKAEADRILAEAKAKQDAERAVAEEKARVAAETKRLDDERIAREKDRKHRAIINNAAVTALIANAQISEYAAREVVKSIANGKIPSVAINY